MYFIDLNKTKSIYDILDVPRTIEQLKLRKAYQKYDGKFRKKANLGDKAAEKKCTELSKLKNEIWNKKNREKYDKELKDGGGLSMSDPVPDFYSNNSALVREFGRYFDETFEL
jgi:DnaJ-class molecular chaperone